MTFVGVTISINESDIIEAYVRYNLRFLDRMIILDNGSSDNTLHIVKRLIDEGLPISVRQDPELNISYRQTNKLNMILREFAEQPDVSHMFPLDPDELLLVPSRESLQQSLQTAPPDHCVLAPWVTYCPTQQDDWDEPDLLRRITHRRSREVEQYYKIIVNRAYFTEGQFTTGNHHLLDRAGKPVATVKLNNIRIAHFPVRWETQMLAKILIGGWALALKTDRKKGEGYHWEALAKRFRLEPSITPAQLEEIATSYASPKPVPLVHDPLPVPDNPVLRYPELIDQDLTRRLIGFTDQLVSMHISDKTNPVIASKAVSVSQCRHGAFACHINDTVIGKSMAQYGEWKEQEITLLRQFVKAGHVVVDIGAYIGTHAVPLAQMTGPDGKVHAFEPQRLAFQLLCSNIALNSLDNVFTHNVAISDTKGSARVPLIKLDTAADYSRSNIANQATGESISIFTLDQLQVNRLDFIKINVAGMELQVLTGAADSIRKFRPNMYIYCDADKNPQALLTEVLDKGYKCWWHIVEYYNPDNFFNNPDNVFAGLLDPTEVNILCLPAENNLQINGLEPVVDEYDSWQAAQQRLHNTGGGRV